ncbi:hypothetical protein RFM52_28990 [Mesorhizobium sp. VK2B]|uniref:Uncharacterized protein n=2 Tax=Mesorhizobium humile TaxID=3072313 RepID=A0ABU4YT16_9HYPH|nr:MULTISPECIES: hypothetical protein [unclassified Mesorhizobium]MDX8463012.1 hypothetical protein [Mesorhizobium sp. VK2D]MDX8489215.1 hypothetical protein [Mesorhizobium sp. VK2B]
MFRLKHFVTRVRLKSDLTNAFGWLMQPICFLRIGERPSRKAPHRRPSWCPPIFPAQFRRAPISINKKAAQPASERDDVLTYISAKPARQDVETLPANDNERAALADLSFLDVINDEDEVADIARRAERLGHATLIAMAIGLAAVPLLYLMLA